MGSFDSSEVEARVERLTAPARLRSILATGRLVVAPGAFDPFTARIIEMVGFPAVYLSGHSIGLQLAVGQPLLTMTEAVESAARIAAAVQIPLIVDADAGFGEPLHTRRTVRAFEDAGAAAIHIEDQPFPKRAGYHRGKGRLAPTNEMVQKLEIAVDAKRDSDFIIIARTDALRVSKSIVETITRCRAYAATGIDMLMVLDLDLADAYRVRSEIPDLQLAWIGGVAGEVPTLKEIEAAGFRAAVFPFTTAAAVTDSVVSTWTHFAETGAVPQTAEFLSRMRQKVLEIVGFSTYWEIEDRTTEPGAK